MPSLPSVIPRQRSPSPSSQPFQSPSLRPPLLPFSYLLTSPLQALLTLILHLHRFPALFDPRPGNPTPSPQTHPSPLHPPLLLPFSHRRSPGTRVPHHHACFPRDRGNQPSFRLVVLREGRGREGEEAVDGFVGGSQHVWREACLCA